MTDFLAMGGYAAYVWPAYGFAALVLLALLVQSWRSARRRDAELEQLRHIARPGRGRRAKPRLTKSTDQPPSRAGLADPAPE